ncbi:glycosyltransferase family 2 protein [Patescibacteria group bacterium]|nr:glycosyltransferase family 2 protein [Patescibacteria group bacterium]
MLDTPIAFIIFKRPDTTEKVFNEIRKIKPKKLFVIADGPRNEKERIKCEKTRGIVNKVDWDCQVYKNYSDVNLGVRERVITGLNWVFEKVEKCIILEDDCLPDQSFFPFCEELLNKYENNKDIMIISGNNHLREKEDVIKDSYYFSKFVYIWGWATWRRTWNLMENNLAIDNNVIKNNFKTFKERIYWKHVFLETEKGFIKSWAYSFFYCLLKNNGISICPRVNLISNIGFGNDSTNTASFNDVYSLKHKDKINFPLRHPNEIKMNVQADIISQKKANNMSLFRLYSKYFLRRLGLFKFIRKIYYKAIN